MTKIICNNAKKNGTKTVVLAAQQYRQKGENGKAEVFANAIKHDFKSKNPTTRWSDIIRLKRPPNSRTQQRSRHWKQTYISKR